MPTQAEDWVKEHTDHRLTLKEFEDLVDKNTKFTNCTLEGLAGWMLDNPTAYIITDLRDDNLKALAMIREVLPDSANRVIPQIYNPQNYDKVKQIGFEQIIWTLYRYPEHIRDERSSSLHKNP